MKEETYPLAAIKSNERELSAKIAQWLDDTIQAGAFSFKSASTETGVAAGAKTLFADVVIWFDRQSNQAASYIELKPPYGKRENLDTFRKKAANLKVPYAFTWDFQCLKCYKVTNGQIELLQEDIIPVLSSVEEWKRGDKQVSIKTVIRKICDELASLLETGKPRSFVPDKIFFVELIRNTTNQLLSVFESFIHKAQYNKVFKGTLSWYARVQGIPTSEDHVKILTNHVVYGFITKIIFYLTLRRYFRDLPALDSDDGLNLSTRIRKAFAKARERDWQAVFEEDPIEELGIPKEAHKILFTFFSELRAYHFGELPEDVLGQLFEEIIDPDKRHSLGQYFTREDLVDLVIAAVVRDVDGYYCDPTCGSGTFLVRLYDRLRFISANKKTHKELLNQIWGFDIGKFPAELSTVNLFRQNISEYESFPRVRKMDIFNVLKGGSFDFPPPHSGSKAIKINLKLPEFTGIVGNFPFIRQELIEKELKGYKRKLTRVLAEEWLQAYPTLFDFKGLKLSDLVTSRQIEKALGKDWLDLRLSGQADIFAYIYLHTSTLLKEDGAFAIITSNSWLDVGYGSVLKQFFLDHFRIKMIIASWAEPWFEDAAVNTVITVLEREPDEEKRKQNQVHFVKLKKKLSELIPFDLKFDSTKRWRTLDAIVDSIQESEYNPQCVKIAENISSYNSEDMRVRILPQQELAAELQRNLDTNKWGKYLRAPDVYFEIVEELGAKIVPLNSLGKVERGYTTGINDFFYLEKIEAEDGDLVECKNERGWQGFIEKEFLIPVLMSPREIIEPTIKPSDISIVMFACSLSKDELRKQNKNHALNYIEWGEKQVTREKQKTKGNIAWPKVPTVANKKLWYSIDRMALTNFIWSKSFNDRFILAKCKTPLAANNRLYMINLDEEIVEKCALIWNSTLQYLLIEVFGRVSLGEGLIDNGIDETKYCLVIDPQRFDNIGKKYNRLLERKIKPVFDEISQKDRIALDTFVLSSLGLDPDQYISRLYEGLCEMVRERIELPKMRKKQQKETVQLAVDQIKQATIDECLANGTKKFPEQFYSRDFAEKEYERFSTSGEHLRYEQFFGQCDMIDAKGQKVFTVESETKARFAVILAKPNVYELKIPKDDKEVLKALNKYKKYVKEVRESLTESAGKQTHDWAVAERIAEELLVEYGLVAEPND
jgi:type I restriction-modification system DNA methylase subunit